MSDAPNAPLGGATPPGKRGSREADVEGYADVVDNAIALRARGEVDLPTPSDPEPAALLRYAAGGLEGEARAEVEAWVARSRWAYGCVVALVKHARADRAANAGQAAALHHTLARRLLDAARQTKGKLPVARILNDAFLEVGGAVAAAAGAGERSVSAIDLQRTVSGALARGDESAALSETLAALARAELREV